MFLAGTCALNASHCSNLSPQREEVMVFNPLIIGAIVLQGAIAKGSRVAGAVAGFVITTGILLWGISLYSDGSQIALFGIPLSEPVFVIACIVWYVFDTREFIAARNAKSQSSDQSPSTLTENTNNIDKKKPELVS